MVSVQVLKSERLMVLTIDRVFPQHFRQYYFQARNKAGSDEIKLILDRRGLSVCLSVLTCHPLILSELPVCVSCRYARTAGVSIP